MDIQQAVASMAIHPGSESGCQAIGSDLETAWLTSARPETISPTATANAALVPCSYLETSNKVITKKELHRSLQVTSLPQAIVSSQRGL